MGYNAYKQFVFTFYYGPELDLCTESIVKLIAECGFTRLAMQGRNNPDKIRRIAEWAGKYGMDVCLYLHTELGTLTSSKADKVPTQENVDKKVQMILDKYRDIPNIVEWQLRDEPSSDHFPVLARITDAFHRLDPLHRPVLINLYPFGVGPDALGCEGAEYLTRFVETCSPDALSFDGYHFHGDPPLLTDGEVYLDNLHKLMKAGQGAGLPTAMIVLASKHLKFSYLEEPQLRWEANLNLVYGCKCVSYFTFSSLKHVSNDLDSNDGGLVTYGYEPTDQYRFVQHIARDIIPIGDQLADKKIEAVFQIRTGLGGETPEYEAFGDLGPVDGDNGMVGFYDDGSFYLMNFRYESDSAPNRFGLNGLKGRELEWFDPAESGWKSADLCGRIAKTASGFDVTLGPGDALLIRAR